MPDIDGTSLETNLLSVLQSSFNGNTSILVPSDRAFYITLNSDPDNFSFDAFVEARGTLSVASEANGTVITLESSEQAAQFRAGDACFLVGNAFANAVGAADNTADAVTVTQVSPANQTVTVDAATRAGGIYSIGASLIRVGTSQPGGVVGNSSNGLTLGGWEAGDLLAAVNTLCSGGTLTGSAGTTTSVTVGSATFTEIDSLLGATVTVTTGAAAGLTGCTGVVDSATDGGATVTMNLTGLKDADGDDVAAWPGAFAAFDECTVELDLSEGKLPSLQEAGADMSTLVAAMLTMHRKLDMITPGVPVVEIPLVNEWNVWGQKTGTLLRTSAPYTDPATTITVELDGAVGDIPFPLSGNVRVIDADDGVDSAAWNSTANDSAFVAYTRQKRSAVLDFGAGFGGLGFDFNTGCIVELQGSVNGFTTNKGFAPDVDNNYLSGLLWQLFEAVRNYNEIGT